MPYPAEYQRDLLIYVVHGAFWAAFALAHRLTRRRGHTPVAHAEPSTARTVAVAPYSRALLTLHIVAFQVLYFGIGRAVLSHRVPAWLYGQRILGTVIIATGALLMVWARVSFQSWRFRAKLDRGHELATGGPFRLLRHPIYMGLNLLALGSAVWVPTVTTWVGLGLMVVGSDLRGRAEERLLHATFGEAYRAYCERTARFLPGLY